MKVDVERFCYNDLFQDFKFMKNIVKINHQTSIIILRTLFSYVLIKFTDKINETVFRIVYWSCIDFFRLVCNPDILSLFCI